MCLAADAEKNLRCRPVSFRTVPYRSVPLSIIQYTISSMARMTTRFSSWKTSGILQWIWGQAGDGRQHQAWTRPSLGRRAPISSERDLPGPCREPNRGTTVPPRPVQASLTAPRPATTASPLPGRPRLRRSQYVRGPPWLAVVPELQAGVGPSTPGPHGEEAHSRAAGSALSPGCLPPACDARPQAYDPEGQRGVRRSLRAPGGSGRCARSRRAGPVGGGRPAGLLHRAGAAVLTSPAAEAVISPGRVRRPCRGRS